MAQRATVAKLLEGGSFRCKLPPKPSSPATAWVKQQLEQRDMTYDELHEEAAPRIRTSIAAAIAHLSRSNSIVAVGTKKKKQQRWRVYRIWSLKKDKP